MSDSGSLLYGIGHLLKKNHPTACTNFQNAVEETTFWGLIWDKYIAWCPQSQENLLIIKLNQLFILQKFENHAENLVSL